MAYKINETVVAIAKQHFAQGSFGVVTFAEAVGVSHKTVYNWLRTGSLSKQKPEASLSPEEKLCIQLADLKADPPLAYTAAWNAILKNLQSATPDLNLAKWVVEQFEDANLAKLEVILANQEKTE